MNFFDFFSSSVRPYRNRSTRHQQKNVWTKKISTIIRLKFVENQPNTRSSTRLFRFFSSIVFDLDVKSNETNWWKSIGVKLNVCECSKTNIKNLTKIINVYKPKTKIYKRKKLRNETKRKKCRKIDEVFLRFSLDDELNRNAKYFNENIDLHICKNQLENSVRELKEENEVCERDKFELEEKLIEFEHRFEKIRDEREELERKISQRNVEIREESVKKRFRRVKRKTFRSDSSRTFRNEKSRTRKSNQTGRNHNEFRFFSSSNIFVSERRDDRITSKKYRKSRIESTSKKKTIRANAQVRFRETLNVFLTFWGNSTEKCSFGKNDRRTSSTIAKVKTTESFWFFIEIRLVFSAKTESIEARLSISNLCDDESFLCDELEERVDVSRRATFAHGQSLFAEINTMVKSIERISSNFFLFFSGEFFSRIRFTMFGFVEHWNEWRYGITNSSIEKRKFQFGSFKRFGKKTFFRVEIFVRTFLFQFHELHSHGSNFNEHFSSLIEQIHCDKDRQFLGNSLTTIEKHFSTLKNFIKKLLENKDVFEGRFRKLQTLLIASRGEKMTLDSSLNDLKTLRDRRAESTFISIENNTL